MAIVAVMDKREAEADDFSKILVEPTIISVIIKSR